MKPSNQHNHTDCPFLKETACHALLPGGDTALPQKLRDHLASCPACQAELEATRLLAQKLRALPQAEPAADLTNRILAALDTPVAKPTPLPHRILHSFPLATKTAAALALLLLGATLLWQLTRPATNPDADTGKQCAWLAQLQQDNGLWRPQDTGGSPTYQPAISALAALALHRHADAGFIPNAQQAQDALLAMQQPNGAFEAPSGTRAYNHGIVTTALLAMRGDATHDPSLRRAIAFIIANQQPSGGWGYAENDAPNTAVSAWQIEALHRASALGWDEARAPLARGLRWLRSCVTPGGRFAYHHETARPVATATSTTLDAIAASTLFSAGRDYPELLTLAARTLDHLADAPQKQIDYYRDYFLARAYSESGREKQMQTVTARMTSHLYPGLQDRWGAVGGDLYTTALTLLSVN